VIDIAQAVEDAIRAKNLFRDGQKILVAVSGGVDSMVLLQLLDELAKSHHWKLTVAHFNHQLRGTASDADERSVRRIAKRLKLPLAAGRGDVKDFAGKHGVSIEMAARKLRHDFLAHTALKLKIPAIALAHHADDQVELFIVRLLRGAGGEGLAGMKWSNTSPAASKVQLVRPLLDTSKAALVQYAATNKIDFAEDETNASLDIQRNRIRHELVPLLTRRYQPALGRTILRVMELLGAEAEFAAETARSWLKSKRPQAFGELPVAVQRRVLHQQLTGLKIAPEFDLIERLRLGTGQLIAVAPDCSALRTVTGEVQLRREEPDAFNPDRRELTLRAPAGKVVFGKVKIAWAVADDNGIKRAQHSPGVEFFDADKLGAAICLRFWQPGDRFQPIGMRSSKKLQDLFTDAKVPKAERRRRIVGVTAQGDLFWVEGLRMAEKFKLDGATARRLEWRWKRLPDRA
jgi:tRNA(Ile)-lysidine synthase